jgi:RNA polymerase I-specific transcription initiation factor RRN5
MSSSPDSSIADLRDVHSHTVLEPSDTSSESVGQSDTNSDQSKVSSRNNTPASQHDRRKTSPRKLPTVRHSKKGKSIGKHYSDHYLEFFKDAVTEFERGGDGVPSVDLLPTQLGAVHWQPWEKESLFNALSRKGRLDEPGIAMVVGKSELEIRDYLIFLREKEAERHLFEKQTKRISHADIPAAMEISGACEVALEQAADALAMFQDQYDTAVAEQQHPRTWLIDWDTATALDERVLDHEEAASDSEDLPPPEDVPGEGLFRLSSWLELSERIFMNPGPPLLHANWHNMATEDQRPALTYATFSDFHNLAVSITRRLMQTCMFLAESRMRSTKGQGYDPKPSVKEQDVLTTLEVLGMTSSLSDILLGVARRNSLCVVRGSHEKGSGRSQVLTYDEVEMELSRRRKSQRGRRSVSTASRSSGTPISVEDSDPHQTHPAVGKDVLDAVAKNSISRDPSPSLISLQDAERDVSMSDLSESDIDADLEESHGDEYGGLSFAASTSRQKRRRVYLESQQDAYMEALDRDQGEAEEERLWQILGREPPVTVKGEAEEVLGNRPKTLRKTEEDLAEWQGVFAGEWEAFGERIPEQRFLETGMAKRPRLDDAGNRARRPSEGRLFAVRTVEAEDDESCGGEPR